MENAAVPPEGIVGDGTRAHLSLVTGSFMKLMSSATPLLPRIVAGDEYAVRECVERYGALIWSLVRRWSPAHATPRMRTGGLRRSVAQCVAV